MNKCYLGNYFGETAVYLQSGKYEAIVLPQIGANMIAFRDTERQFKFLREPAIDEMSTFKKTPYIHGIPVLFPPNRIEDGKFPWEGKTYQFPINEPKTGNHLHGFVHNIPWELDHFGADDLESRVSMSLTVSSAHPIYKSFPHSFSINLQYSLNESGLLQQVSVRNLGKERMPCLLGFHTTINAPFASNSAASEYRFKLTIGDRWELNNRMLPTGEFQRLSLHEEAMKSGEASPFFESMDNHYTAVAQDGRNRMELTDHHNNVKLIYDVGTAYKQWMIWNNNAQEGFFCPEPQINLVNAPNAALPAEQIGLVGLEPGEIWEETSRLYCIYS